MKPLTQYTKSGSINIAYQTFGSGPVDLVYIPGWVSNIDLMWACPELVDFLLSLGKIARVILFDKRGTGLSDRIVEFSTLEERMDDIRAVMDAVKSEKAVLFGHSEGGSVSALFAATYPERTISLVAFGIFAKRRNSPEYPWAPTDRERQQVYEMIEHSWGSGDMNLETLAPSKANDPVFMNWLADYFRSGASPSAALVLTKMNTQVDIVDILSAIQVPTLIMQRAGDIDVKIEEARFIADRIKHSKLKEFAGNDHLFWVGNTTEILSEMQSFIGELKPRQSYEERLFTIVACRIEVAETDENRAIDLIKEIVVNAGGEIIPDSEKIIIAAFEGPSKAIHCGLEMIAFMKSLSLELSLAIDLKEVRVEEDRVPTISDFKSLTDLLRVVPSNSILATQSVRFLLAGVGMNFEEFTTGQQKTFLVSSQEEAELQDSSQQHVRIDAFLEEILNLIRANSNDESFGVEQLCQLAGFSERHLQRKLKAITNKSPVQLIASVRLHKAKELLHEGKKNISEIAYMTGFSNPSYFTKCFKREFGKSPSAM